jgi:hypothetical protein
MTATQAIALSAYILSLYRQGFEVPKENQKIARKNLKFQKELLF